MFRETLVKTRTLAMASVLLLFAFGTALEACSPANDTASPGTTSALDSPAANPTSAAGDGVAIAFRSNPDPPSSGENTFEAEVTEPDGSAVTDATVEVVFSMPAMPSMNMPAMRSTATLTHEGAGRYRATGQLSMTGTWNVVVTATRGTEEIGRTTFSVIAR